MIRATWHFTYRLLFWSLILGTLLFALLVLGLRYWVLPNIADYRADISAAISRMTGVPSHLGKVEAGWDGLRPHLKFADLTLEDERRQQGLALTEVEGTLSWWSLLFGDLQFHTLEITRPELTIRREKDGTMHVAGIKLGKKPEQSGGFGDWLLSQDEVIIRDAIVTWQDEVRIAPTLKFTGVNARMLNGGVTHQIGFTATPPTDLATPVDVRAELRGASLLNMNEWNGSVYARMDSANVAAWGVYLPLPSELQKGTGGVQAWVDFEGSHISDSVADLQLADVSAKFKPDLPPLGLEKLNGRLSYRERASGFNFSGKDLDFTLANSKINVPEADYFFQYSKGSEKLAPAGELLASALELEVLRLVADALPFDAVHRKKLDQFAPKGRVENVAIKWSGEPEAPLTYSAKLKFNNVSVASVDDLPGLTGMNGEFEATENGGTLSLDNKTSEVNLAKIFSQPLRLDSFTVQTAWTKTESKIEIELQKIAFANADTSGQISGKVVKQANGSAVPDIKASFSGIKANDIYRYIPIGAGEKLIQWLQGSLKSGRAENIALDLKGNLADFPFENNKNGLFRISAKIVNADLDYAERWPKVENIQGDFLLNGKRLEIHANGGVIANAKILRADAIIAELSNDPSLKIDGKITGAVEDKIRFLNNTPVNELIDGFAQGMKASGNGTLDLQLALPLAHIKDSKVSGQYHFQNNHIEGGKIWPALDNVTGSLFFGPDGVQIKDTTAIAFGGPVTIIASRQPEGGLVIDASGKANVDEMLTLLNVPAQDWMEGVTDWTAKATVIDGTTKVTVDSTLLGITSTLPQPLNKNPAIALPLHVERKIPAIGQEQYEVTLGKEMRAVFLRAPDDKGVLRVRKGTLALNTDANLQAKDGIFVSGALDELNLDVWRSYLRRIKPGAVSGAMPSAIGLRGFDLTVSKLIALDKIIGVTRVTAELNGTAWQSNIVSNDINGTLTWKPEGQGNIIARFKNFMVPDSIEEKAVTETPVAGIATPPAEVDFPALDIVAEEFRVKKRVLGRLELLAKPEARNWRLEKMTLDMPDATLHASGLWQGLPAKPNTAMDMKLEVRDIGKFLAHLGQPDSVRGGTSNLSGKLAWVGNPYDFTPTILSGNFRLEALKGQFLQIPSSGAGKLLSLISLQALPRRISLDFRDVFSSGIAFDDMAGSFVVDKGLMSTNDFVINSTAAIVTMEGSVNLAQENQNLRVKVIPAASDTVAIATTLLGGPVAGIVSYVLQKWLKNPFGEIAAYQYAVTGTWDDPQVNKIVLPSPTQTPGYE